MLSHFSHVQLCVTLWTAARQAPLSMGFSVHGILQTRIPEWVACPPPRDLPNPRIEPTISYVYLPWQAGSLPLTPARKPDAMSTRCQRIFSYLLPLSRNPHLSSSKSHISWGPQHPTLTAILLRMWHTWDFIQRENWYIHLPQFYGFWDKTTGSEKNSWRWHRWAQINVCTHSWLYYIRASLTLGDLNLLCWGVNMPAFTLEEHYFCLSRLFAIQTS